LNYQQFRSAYKLSNFAKTPNISIMRVLLDIKDSKAIHLMEVLNGLSYVKIKTISEEKAQLIENIKEAIDELALIREGKLKGIPAKQLLDEL
jgi:hypothetical protein